MKMPARTKLLAACITGCLILPPTMAIAGPDEAAEYYEQASEAYEAGDFASAADLLDRAYSEDPNLIYQYNRVLALQAMGKFDQALETLDTYGEAMRADGRFEDIKQIRTELEVARAEASGEADDDAAVAETNGEDTDVEDPLDTGELDDVDQPTGESGPHILGWSLVGAGVAGLGAAGLFGSTVLISDVDDRRDCAASEGASLELCFGEFDDPQDQLDSDRDTWSTHRTLTWVSLGVGAAALITGGALLLADNPHEAESDASLSARSTDVRFSPYVGGDGAGGMLHISF